MIAAPGRMVVIFLEGNLGKLCVRDRLIETQSEKVSFQLRSNAGSEFESKESSDFVCPGTIPPALHEAALLHILCPVPALP